MLRSAASRLWHALRSRTIEQQRKAPPSGACPSDARLCGLQGGETHFFTNRTLLKSLSFTKNYKPIADGTLSLAYLGEFLHEGTHHTCLTTPVGLALSSLQLIALASHYGHPEVAGLRNAVGRAGYVRDGFRPILEGLALFAQFDLGRDDSGESSVVISRMMIPFAGSELRGLSREAIERGGMEEVFGKKLFMARLSEHAVANKSALLAKSLDQDPASYLAGYLWIKAYWLALMQRDGRYWDPEYFFCFLIFHIFEDEEFAALLGEPTAPEDLWLEEVERTLLRKMTPVSVAEVHEVEERLKLRRSEKATAAPRVLSPAIGTRLVTSLERLSAAMGMSGMIATELVQGLLARTDLFRIVTERVDLEVNADGHIWARSMTASDESVPLLGAWVKDRPELNGRRLAGTIEIVLNYNGLAGWMVVIYEGQILRASSLFTGATCDGRDLEALKGFVSAETADRFVAEMSARAEEAIRHEVSTTDEHKIEWDDSDRRRLVAMYGLYGNDTQIERATIALSAQGFGAALESHPELMRTWVILSLLGPTGRLTSAARLLGIRVDDVRARIEDLNGAISPLLGTALVVVSGDDDFVCVV